MAYTGNDHVVIVTRNFTDRSLFYPCPLPTSLYRRLPRFIRPLSRTSKYRRTLPYPPIAADAHPISLPTLAVMHYETRNDESAYVSHVMEIPLLIRALNDSATAGYITCIITLVDERRDVQGNVLSFIFYFFPFFRLSASDVLSTGEER